MEPSQIKTDQTSAVHNNNSSSKTEILSIKTSCPIASVSAQSLKSANNDVLFCCGTFEESNKNKLYFSKFNGDAGTLKAAIAVDHYLPPSKLIFNPSKDSDASRMLLSTGADVIIWGFEYSSSGEGANNESCSSQLSVIRDLNFSSSYLIDCPVISASWNEQDLNVIATGLVDGCVFVWDIETGAFSEKMPTVRSTKCKARAKVALYKNEVFDLTFRPNCKNDLYCGGREGVIKHVDIRSAGEFNQCYKQPDKTAIVRIAFNDLNNNQLAFSTSESPFVSLLDLRWPAKPVAFFQTPSRVNSLQWAPRASLLSGYIASGSNDGSVCIWDANSLNEPGIKEYPALTCRMGKGIWNFLWFPTDPSYLGVATDSGFQILQI